LSFYDSLPALNAILNGTAAVLLVIGFLLIRSGNIQMHRRVMLTAFGVSVVFLVSYLLNHYHAGIVYYKGTGFMRTLYFLVLWTHTPLAAAVPVLAIITLSRGLKGRIAAHRAIAKWTLPIWLYVSVTGVVVYEMLYRS
jgi:uncharacterized membrane protein YozB (DUF420 family)